MTKILYRFSYLFWLLGLLLPALYVLGLTQIKAVIHAIKSDKTAQVLFGFLLFQLVLLAASTRFDFVTTERFIAAGHNVACFGFILLGYAIMSKDESRQWVEKYSKEIFIAFTVIVLGACAISWFFRLALEYPGLLALWIENKFSLVQFTRIEYHNSMAFPRSRALNIYANGTAMLLTLSFLLFMRNWWSSFGSKTRLLYHLLFVAAIFFTGSRLYLLFAVALSVISQLGSFAQLRKWLKWLPPLAIVGGFAAFYLFFFRSASNSTRMMIYSETVAFWWENGPLLGVGIKPIVPGHSYPMGSHSTLLGYFFRYGLIGGVLTLIGYFVMLRSLGSSILKRFRNVELFDPKSIHFLLGVLMVLASTALEDIDAFEFTSLYIGLVLWQAFTYFRSTRAL